MSLSDKLKNIKQVKQAAEPLWKGPIEDGVTQSMLSKFLGCRERFRIQYVEGLKPQDVFNHKMFYGSAWHVCEEALAAGTNPTNRVDQWTPLNEYTAALRKQYPMSQEQINHWAEVCKIQFPRYVKYWARRKDTGNRTPLLQEQVFDVPYTLPSGRTVRLRGKWDGIILLEK